MIVRPTYPPVLRPTIDPIAAAGGLPWQQGVGGIWTPAALGSKLKIWYRGDAGVVTSGTEVTNWLDQSGSAYNLAQSTSTNRPSTRVVNGRIAIDFDGSDNRLIAGANTSTVLGTPGIIEINAVWVADALGAGTIFSAPNLFGQDTNNYFTNSASSAAFYGTFTDTGGTARTASTAAAPSADIVYRTRAGWDSNLVFAKLGSGTTATAACTGHNASSYTGNKILLGWNASQNAHLNGAICEIIVTVGTVLTAAERALIDAWLSGRWGAVV